VLCLTGIASIAYSPAARGDQSRPRAVVDYTRHDFGVVFAGEQIFHVFTIRNEGSAPLTLLDKSRDTEGRTRSRNSLTGRLAYARMIAPDPVPT
jgi:hypothetical protein